MHAGGVPYGLIDSAAVAVADGRIAWIGPAVDLPADYAGWPAKTLDGLLTPALIDCHTHLVYGGDRANEWEARLNGASYADIARAGGGIMATVRATRAASEEALMQSALPRLAALESDGVGLVEIKSGYGLDFETERKMLRVARRLGDQCAVRVKTSFLGAHALPPEYEGRADAYIDMLAGEMLPALAAQGLVDYCDGFCESIAFNAAQIERLFAAAQDLGLGVRLHAEQLANTGGAVMAARMGALSCDHLEYLDGAGIAAMQTAHCRAVLLPGAFYFLQETRKPPVQALRDAGIGMALASDCNPGSSPICSLLVVMNMGCTLFGLTPEEALAGVTREAAGALGMEAECGTIEVGKRADFALWDVDHPAQLSYFLGARPLRARMMNGKWVNNADN